MKITRLLSHKSSATIRWKRNHAADAIRRRIQACVFQQTRRYYLYARHSLHGSKTVCGPKVKTLADMRITHRPVCAYTCYICCKARFFVPLISLLHYCDAIIIQPDRKAYTFIQNKMNSITTNGSSQCEMYLVDKAHARGSDFLCAPL